MSRTEISRRRVLKEMGLAALFAASEVKTPEAYAQTHVPNSAGTDSPKLKAPANSRSSTCVRSGRQMSAPA
jgi:hypothetical protein